MFHSLYENFDSNESEKLWKLLFWCEPEMFGFPIFSYEKHFHIFHFLKLFYLYSFMSNCHDLISLIFFIFYFLIFELIQFNFLQIFSQIIFNIQFSILIYNNWLRSDELFLIYSKNYAQISVFSNMIFKIFSNVFLKWFFLIIFFVTIFSIDRQCHVEWVPCYQFGDTELWGGVERALIKMRKF